MIFLKSHISSIEVIFVNNFTASVYAIGCSLIATKIENLGNK